MATISIVLVTDRPKKDGTYPLKIAVRHKKYSAYIHLGMSIRADQWDEQIGKVVKHPNRTAINAVLEQKLYESRAVLLSPPPNIIPSQMSVNELRDFIRKAVFNDVKFAGKGTFYRHYLAFVERHENQRTREIYMATMKKIQLLEDPTQLNFEDITKDWLERFYVAMAKESPSVNARNIHLRNIRAVFNDAIDNELTTRYPFRRMKIRPQETRKRALTVEQLRALFAHDLYPFQHRFLDTFKLCFYLIGINMVDLCRLTEANIINGRLVYVRAKTKKTYSIKIEPEAQELLDKWKGKNLLFGPVENYEHYRFLANNIDKGLKTIGRRGKHVRQGKKMVLTYVSDFPGISIYWARHTWATIAAELDIPKETIAAALGHGGNSVTDIYIDFNLRKIDEANRRVIDYVLYNKRAPL